MERFNFYVIDPKNANFFFLFVRDEMLESEKSIDWMGNVENDKKQVRERVRGWVGGFLHVTHPPTHSFGAVNE